jgi:hypothetical protein
MLFSLVYGGNTLVATILNTNKKTITFLCYLNKEFVIIKIPKHNAFLIYNLKKLNYELF